MTNNGKKNIEFTSILHRLSVLTGCPIEKARTEPANFINHVIDFIEETIKENSKLKSEIELFRRNNV